MLGPEKASEATEYLLRADKVGAKQWLRHSGLKKEIIDFVFNRKLLVFVVSSLLLISNTLTWVISTSTRGATRLSEPLFPNTSLFANLPADDLQSYHDSQLPVAVRSDDNETYHFWQSITTNNIAIAVPESVTAEWDTAPSLPFVWDHDKRIYEIAGYHSLHCVKIIGMALHEYKYGLPLTRSWNHVMHCVARLRSDVMCYADDTPYPVSHAGADYGQIRQCRSWDKLDKWAKRWNACYGLAHQNQSDKIEYFKFCPQGSPYMDKVAKIWGQEWIEALKQPMAEFDWIPY